MALIRFGIKKIELGYFSAFDLRIIEENKHPGFAFFYIQNYFHIWYLPIISLGCKWVMIHKGEFYEIPNEYRKKISEYNVKLKGKWYANIGMYLLIGGTVIATVIQFINNL